MNDVAGLCAIASVVLGLGFGTRARAQNIEIIPADAPPPKSAPATPPEVTPAPAPEAPPPSPEVPQAATPEEAPAPPAEAGPAAVPGPAAFGEAWHYAISIERAVGVDHISQTESFSGTDSSTATATNLSLFGVPSSGTLSAFSFPRAAFDLFVASDFSVGLGLGLIHGSTSIAPVSGVASSQSSTGIVAAPRAGYAWHLTPDITLWSRAGISVVYVKASSSNNYASQDVSEHLVAATIELPVLFAVAPRVAVTAGPTLDITFSGTRTAPGLGDGFYPAPDEHVTELGLQAGLLIYF